MFKAEVIKVISAICELKCELCSNIFHNLGLFLLFVAIQVIRNPFDALVSWYHFYQENYAFGYYKGSWEEFFTMVSIVRGRRIVCLLLRGIVGVVMSNEYGEYW